MAENLYLSARNKNNICTRSNSLAKQTCARSLGARAGKPHRSTRDLTAFGPTPMPLSAQNDSHGGPPLIAMSAPAAPTATKSSTLERSSRSPSSEIATSILRTQTTVDSRARSLIRVSMASWTSCGRRCPEKKCRTYLEINTM